MRFKLDENLDPHFATPLLTAGHDVANARASISANRTREQFKEIPIGTLVSGR